MKALIILGMTCLFFASCADDSNTQETTTDPGINQTQTTAEGWTNDNRNQFLSECMSNLPSHSSQEQAERYCSCLLEKVQARYANYSEADSVAIQRYNEMGKDCP